MKKFIEYISTHKAVAVLAVVLVAAAIIVPIAIGGGSASEETAEGKTTYTCSMHPQIKQDKPGRCPICGMDLIPAGHSHAGSGHGDMDMSAMQDGVMLSEEAMALANVETQVVGTGSTSKEVRLFGKVEPDQRLEQTQAAYVEGRVEKLAVSAVGDQVKRGQTIAVIYSPSLYTASQELVAALHFPAGEQRKTMVEAAKEKLRLLNVTQQQIGEIVRSGKASPYFSLKANTSGTVVEKSVSPGDYVKQGQPLLKIANLSTVWVMFQAYEGDLPFVRKGAEIQFTSEAMPGRTFRGRVSFIDPVLDAKSRTAGVRVVMSNPGGIFKPEMIVTGVAAADMSQYKGSVVVPKSAVLWTGKRSVVYVKEDDGGMPMFYLREVTLGPSLPDSYVIADGLAEGEEIVTNGAFAIDASAQLEGKHSMMNR